MLTFYTAGESHGRGVFAFLDGVPAGLEIKRDLIDADLARRQMGYGRGGRMRIEQDTVDCLSGVRGSVTLGSPIVLAVWNKDFENWRSFMDPWKIEAGKELYTPRPGHADLAGAVRFGHKDLRNVLERASARETAGRVAAGGVLRCFLKALGVEVISWVTQIGEVRYEGGYDRERCAASSVFCPDHETTRKMEQAIDAVMESGDTLGGEFTLEMRGLPAGIGSYTQWDQRLDTMVAGHLMSIPAIKAVQIGLGTASAATPGSRLHDAILPGGMRGSNNAGGMRGSNNAGGMEGGVSNGEAITVTCTMKPIPTLLKGLPSIDIRDGSEASATYERSDYCAVPAASVVGEAMLMIAVAKAILQSFPRPSMSALLAAFDQHRSRR